MLQMGMPQRTGAWAGVTRVVYSRYGQTTGPWPALGTLDPARRWHSLGADAGAAAQGPARVVARGCATLSPSSGAQVPAPRVSARSLLPACDLARDARAFSHFTEPRSILNENVRIVFQKRKYAPNRKGLL
jgi:hypothetical protein